VSYYGLVINGGGLTMFACTRSAGPIVGSVGYNGVTGRIPLSQSFLAFFNAGDALQIQATSVLGGSATFSVPQGFPGPDASLTIVRVQ